MLFRSKTSSGFFEDRYRQKADPWNFAASDYEQGRFETIARALAGRRYHRALEPGCSIGTLTERLAELCDRVEASDFSATAVAHAAERCRRFPHVHITQAAFGKQTVVEGYDLLVLSEIGYYFSPRRWRSLVDRMARTMTAGSTLLASHWLGQTRDHRQSGDQVHATLREEPLFQLEHEERQPGFRLDRFVRL